ncbi:MAG: DUF2524 family protein [Bacilli bacterium]
MNGIFFYTQVQIKGARNLFDDGGKAMSTEAIYNILEQVEEACEIAETQLLLIGLDEYQSEMATFSEAQYILDKADEELSTLESTATDWEKDDVSRCKQRVMMLKHEMIAATH